MTNACRQCGFPYDPSELKTCPKCQTGADQFGYLPALEVDVVHAGETWELAKAKIAQGLDHAIAHHHRGVKIIHGYGSLSGSSVIAPQAIAYMRQLAESVDGRFAKDSKNPGVSIIWLNRTRSKNEKGAPPTEWLAGNDLEGSPIMANWFEQALKNSQPAKEKEQEG